MMISKDIQYIGVNDHELDLFEGQYIVPGGMAYNSYVILDEKTAVLDSVDARFGEQWLNNLAAALGDRKPDYLIVQHMEPDHSANIIRFTEAYPDATVVASAKAFQMMKSFYGTDLNDRRLVVGEKDTLTLGRHTLTFITAPMVHWPEVIFTWDAADGVLFSADAFGKFGALDYDDPEGWACEARRYYFGIVGKYGTQVQAVLKKLAGLEIKTICPLHGPVLDENLPYYLGLYQTWSSYGTESEGIVINYTSVYGHTKEAAEKLAEMLRAKGCPKVAVNDLARCDMPEAVEDTFRYGKAVLATTTYNADIFPFMRTFIEHLKERNWQNKTVGLIENGTWAPMAAKTMKAMLEGCKNLTILEPAVKITSALNAESEKQLAALAEALMA
ncbi:MAG: FprA family A-type flavoprotein [Clostridia bacterium]|nr:FprA family A-type flavoprotein [Clostridia bacterium]MBR7174457.1 FprA family A-type flavoprotein [Clostridia bacterium]